MEIETIVDTRRYPLADRAFRDECRAVLDRDGVVLLSRFLKSEIVASVKRAGEAARPLAYFSRQEHNVYLAPPDKAFPPDHPRNRTVISSKGCITDDVIDAESPLRVLYDSPEFRAFLCSVLDEDSLYPYADPLSSINLHYADPGQELGWHFDNSSFAVTLMIQKPDSGGAFEYVGSLRDADGGEMNFEAVDQVLGGSIRPKQLTLGPGALVLFRGRNALHRVAPVGGSRTRMLVVLAYNTQPGIALSESARMKFYGRLA